MNAWSKSRGNEARELCGSGVKITEYDVKHNIGKDVGLFGCKTR